MLNDKDSHLRVGILSYSVYDVDMRVKRYAESLGNLGVVVDVLRSETERYEKEENHNNINILSNNEKEI